MIAIQENTNNKSQQNSISINPATQLSQQSNPTNAKYIYVIYEDGAWGMHKQLKPLGAVRDELGWWINNSIENRNIVTQLCKQAGLTYLLRDDLPANDLETYGRLNRLEYHQEQAAKNKQEFDHLKSINKLEDVDIDISLDDLKERTKNEAIITQHKEYHERQKSIIRLQKEDFVANLTREDTIVKKIKTTIQLLDEQEERLLLYRGKEFIGLPQKTLLKLDNLLLGLRKFIVLAAAPNVGKTAMSIQLGLDVIKCNDDACLVYVSLEMSREDVIDRMRCHLTPMTYKKLYFGSTKDGGNQGWYTANELESLENSKSKLEKLAPRILILSEEDSPQLTAAEIMQHVNELKKSTGCSRAIVVIDYLQVFPIEDKGFNKIFSENDADRYRISQIKRLRAELKNDPLIVIAEARKPSSSGNNWATSMADILGSSRIAYACDAGMLLNVISDDELKVGVGNTTEGNVIREHLSSEGLSLLKLTIDKGRDGMQKGDILLKYHFFENRFEETTWNEICEIYNGPLSEYPNMAKTQSSNKIGPTNKTANVKTMAWAQELGAK